MNEDVLRLAAIGSATVSDTLDRLGLPGSARGLSPLQQGQRMAGPAYTVRYVPAGHPVGTVGDYADDVEPGSIVVIDNQGRTDATVWGDILTEMAANRGFAGTAIWGVCRDVATALRLNYPIYSHGRFMRTGKDRVEVADVQIPVALGDAQVRPRDIVVGDDDGVVIISAARLAEVRDLAERIAAIEDNILGAVVEGASLAEARAQFGYHILQRREG